MNNFLQKIKIWFILTLVTKIWRFLEGIKVKIAKSDEELDEVFRFRWEVYSRCDYIDPVDFPDQKLKDKYDKIAFNLMAFKKNILVGILRLIPPSPLGLPTQNAFNIIDPDFPEGRIGEISKLCIRDIPNRDCRKKIFLILMSEAYKISKKNKISYWLIGTPPSLKAHFEKLIEKLNIRLYFKELKVGPLKPENIEERRTAKKYFEKYQIIPFLIKL